MMSMSSCECGCEIKVAVYLNNNGLDYENYRVKINNLCKVKRSRSCCIKSNNNFSCSYLIHCY